MEQLVIDIFGTIVSSEPQYIGMPGTFCSHQLNEILKKNSSAKSIHVRINSPGGNADEGFAIYEMLRNSGKKVTTEIVGICNSIATVILLAGEEREGPTTLCALIHNPWSDPAELGPMTASDYSQMADYMKKCEDKVVELYVQRTGADRETIIEKMNVSAELTANEALELKFLTKIKDFAAPAKRARALAFVSPKKSSDMSDTKGLKAQLVALAKKMGYDITKIKTGKEKNPAKNLDWTSDKGDKLHIATEGEMPKEGDEVTMVENGDAAADGTYSFESAGVSFTVKDGKITAIEEMKKDEEDTDDDYPAEAKAKIEKLNKTITDGAKKYSDLEKKHKDLDKKNKDLEEKLAKQGEEIEEIEATIQMMAKGVKSGYVPKKGEGAKNKTSGEGKQGNSYLADRLAKKKEDRKASSSTPQKK